MVMKNNPYETNQNTANKFRKMTHLVMNIKLKDLSQQYAKSVLPGFGRAFLPAYAESSANPSPAFFSLKKSFFTSRNSI